MTEKYLTRSQVLKKYNLNKSKFEYAMRFAGRNGLYKAVYRVRARVYLRQDYFEEWLKHNDIVSPSAVWGRGASRKTR